MYDDTLGRAYSGTSLIWTPLGWKNASCIQWNLSNMDTFRVEDLKNASFIQWNLSNMDTFRVEDLKNASFIQWNLSNMDTFKADIVLKRCPISGVKMYAGTAFRERKCVPILERCPLRGVQLWTYIRRGVRCTLGGWGGGGWRYARCYDIPLEEWGRMGKAISEGKSSYPKSESH